MTLLEFAQDTLSDCKACYIAIIPNDGVYDLEIEINEGTIASVFHTEAQTDNRGLRKARKLANELEAVLIGMGVIVYKTREEWENSFPVH